MPRMNATHRSRICIVQDAPARLAATFLRAQSENLPADVTVIDGVVVPQIEDRPILSQSVMSRAGRMALRRLMRREWHWELTWAYQKAFRIFRPRAVLAQFGA